MSKLKLIGIAVASAILVFALAARAFPKIGAAAVLPIMTVVLSVLTATDFIALKKEPEKNGPARAAAILRAVSLAVITLIVLFCTVVYFVF